MSDESSGLLKVSVFRSKTDRVPKSLDVSWATLTHKLSQYDFREDKDGALFSPAEYAPETTRSVANVLRVHFLGLRGDVPAVLSGSDIVVLSSKHEGLARCIMEGMAAGKPVVATDIRETASVSSTERRACSFGLAAPPDWLRPFSGWFAIRIPACRWARRVARESRTTRSSGC